MANRYATKTGNWSDVTVWDGGTTLPQSGDTVRPNGYTVTIDQDITVSELRHDASSPAAAGGTFLFQQGKTITGNVTSAYSGILMSLTGTGSSRSIVGNVSASSGTAIYAQGTDGLTITGNLSTTGNAVVVSVYDRMNLTVTGNVSASSTGNAIADATSASICSLSITGDVTCTGSAAAIQIFAATGTFVLTGSVTSGAYNAIILPNLTTVIHNGNQIDGTSGHRAIHTPKIWISSTVQTQYQVRTNNSGVVGSLRSLYTGGVNLGQPIAANVRSGTVFGASSEYTGTLAVPSPTLVAIGVATDNTVGSYNPSVNASDIRSAIGLASANLDTQLSNLQSDTDNIQTRLPTSLVSGRMDSTVGAMQSDVLTSSALAASAVTEIQSGLATQTSVDAIKAKTDNLPADPADQSAVELAITNATSPLATQVSVNDIPTNAELATALAAADDAVLAAIAALNNLSTAQVNAELLDVLSVDTFGELSAPPAATSSLKDKITWLFMWAKNKATETSTQRKLYADNSTTVVSTETVSDDGTTFTKTKAS